MKTDMNITSIYKGRKAFIKLEEFATWVSHFEKYNDLINLLNKVKIIIQNDLRYL